MMRHLVPTVLATAACLAIAARAAVAETHLYTLGHADIGAGYEGGQLHLHFHAEGATLNGVAGQSGEYDVAEIVTVVPPTTQQTRPTGSQWDFLGVPAGAPFYRLSSSGMTAALEGAPFLGLGAEEINAGVFQGNAITFALTGVVSKPAGGHFSLYQSDGTRLIDTADGSFANDSFPFPTGLHDHANWAFTAPGEYKLQWTVSGNLTGGGSTSDTGVVTFQVVPEPAGIALLCSGAAVAGAALLRRRARRARNLSFARRNVRCV